MPVIKIKASVEKKDEKLKNVRDIIKILDRVYADEKLLVSFKDKLHDWTSRVIQEWRWCNAESSDEFLSLTAFRVLSTTLISVCFLEFLRCFLTDAPDISYLTLTAVYYLLLLVMDFSSAVMITYLRSPSTFFYQIYEYFEMVLCMHRLLNRRMNDVQRRMNLKRVRQNNLPPDIYAFEENSTTKFSYSLFSLYSFYGMCLSLCIFVPSTYFRYESWTFLKYLTFNLLFLVGSSKIFAILKFLTLTVKRRKSAQASTDAFRTWFDDECELKRILQESRENTKIFSAFAHRKSKTFPADEYLNFLIFAVICERVLRSNFNDQDLEKAVLVLLYGQFNVDSRSNQLIQITTSCEDPIKSVKILDENKMVKPTHCKEMKENDSVTAKTDKQDRKKSKIPRSVCCKKLTPLSPKPKMLYVPTSNASVQEPTSGGIMGNLNDLPDNQNSDPVRHFDSLPDEENDEGLFGMPVPIPSTTASNTKTNVTLEMPLNDGNSIHPNGTSTEGYAELAVHSKSSRRRKNEEVDLIGTAVTPTTFDSSTILKSTLQVSFQDENVGNRKDIPTEPKTDSVIDSNSGRGEKIEIDGIGAPETLFISESNSTVLQQSSHNEDLRYQNDPSAEQEYHSDIDSNSRNEEINAEETPETTLIFDSNTVMKTALQEQLQGENIWDQNDLSAVQKSYPDIHCNSGKEGKNAEEDFNETPETPLIFDSNALQEQLQGENIWDQNDLSAEPKSYPDSYSHPNSGNEEENSKINLNLILANEETDITPNLFLAVDTSRNSYRIISITDVINDIDFNTKARELCIINNENTEADIPYDNGKEITSTAQNSGSKSNKTEPSSNSVTVVMDDTNLGAKISNGISDKSSGDEIGCVLSPMFSNKENVVDGYSENMDLNANALSELDAGGVQYFGNEKNELSLLKGSEETGTILRNEIPNKSFEVTGNDALSPQNVKMQSCNSFYSENQTDNFLKRPEAVKGETFILNNFSEEELSTNQRIQEEKEESRVQIPNQNGYSSSIILSDSQKIVVDDFVEACKEHMSKDEQAEEELSTVQEIGPSTVNEMMVKLLECISNQNSDLNIYRPLILNCPSDNDKITLYNFLLAHRNNLRKNVDESANNPESSPKNDEDDELSECFMKLNIQSRDTTSIASNENIPRSDSNEGYTTIVEVFQTEDLLTETKQNAASGKTFSSCSTRGESAPKFESSACVDREQNTNQNRFEQNTPNNDTERCGLAYDSQKIYRTPKVKDLNGNSYSLSFSTKEGEKQIEGACDRNNESNEILPDFESTRNPTNNVLKTDGKISHASWGNSEINQLEYKCSENKEMLAEDALKRNGSEPKIPTENPLLSTGDKRAEVSDDMKTRFEISEHKPNDDVTGNVHHFSANNSPLPTARKILKGKRHDRKVVGRKRQASKREAEVIIRKLQESENVNGMDAPNIDTESSKLSTAMQENTSFELGNFANLLRGTNVPWGNLINRNNRNETTEEIIISQVQNESETNPSVNSANDATRISSKNVELMKSSGQEDDSNVLLGTRDPANTPVFSVSNPNKPKEFISDVTDSASPTEVDTNVSLPNPSQEGPRNKEESPQTNGDLASTMERRSRASIPTVVNEAQKNTTEEKVSQEVSDNEKGKSKRETDQSRVSRADESKESSRDIPAVRSSNESCDSIASSSDSNRETFMSLNERKIEVADHSQKLEKNDAFDSSSLDGRTHSDENVLNGTVCEPGEIFTDGGKENKTGRPRTERGNSQNSIKKECRKESGQSKTKRTSDSNDGAGKQHLNCEDSYEKRRVTEVTRKKDRRYLCLLKCRGIVNTERCEIELNERQASYVNSCEKLSVTQETTSLRMMDNRNGQSENAREASFNQFSENDRGTRNKDIQEWITSVSSLKSSSTLSERPPTGSSEDVNFHFRPSTSVSNSTAAKNTEKFSESSVDPPNYSSLPEEFEINPGGEFFSELNGERGGIRWQSNLECDSGEKNCGDPRRGNECDVTDECWDVDKGSTPVNYHLRCDNLEMRFLDSQPNLTLRFVRETQNESMPTTQKTVEKLTRSDSGDEMFLPTDTSSLHDGRVSPTHPSEIPAISDSGDTVRMSAERLAAGLTGNASATDKHRRGHDEPTVSEPEKSRLHPLSTTQRLELPSPNQSLEDVLPLQGCEPQRKAASTSDDPENKPDGNVCAADNTTSKNCEKSEDFVFESETMKIDYKPYSNSESISISYRRQRNASKLKFKSPEKKLYLKTSRFRSDRYFENHFSQ